MAGFCQKVSSMFQHLTSMGKDIPAGVNRWFDRLTIFNLISSGSALIWIGGNENRLIPVAEKYFLAGDTDVVERVKTQIHAECIRPKFMQMTRIMRNIEIEIIENKKQYKTLNDDKNKQTAILLCISTDTKWNYCLPDESPQNTKLSKYVFVETIGGENTLYDDLLWSLRESPKTAGFVKDSIVTAISPIIPEQYMNTKISTDTWHFCYFCFGVCVSIIAKGKLKDIVSKR